MQSPVCSLSPILSWIILLSLCDMNQGRNMKENDGLAFFLFGCLSLSISLSLFLFLSLYLFIFLSLSLLIIREESREKRRRYLLLLHWLCVSREEWEESKRSVKRSDLT